MLTEVEKGEVARSELMLEESTLTDHGQHPGAAEGGFVTELQLGYDWGFSTEGLFTCQLGLLLGVRRGLCGNECATSPSLGRRQSICRGLRFRRSGLGLCLLVRLILDLTHRLIRFGQRVAPLHRRPLVSFSWTKSRPTEK